MWQRISMPAVGSTAGVPFSRLKASAMSSNVAVPSASTFIRIWNSADSGSALDAKTAANRERHGQTIAYVINLHYRNYNETAAR